MNVDGKLGICVALANVIYSEMVNLTYVELVNETCDEWVIDTCVLVETASSDVLVKVTGIARVISIFS